MSVNRAEKQPDGPNRNKIGRFLLLQFAPSGTGPAEPAAAGPIIWQTGIFFCSHYINFREREMNPGRSFFLAAVVFCNLPLL